MSRYVAAILTALLVSVPAFAQHTATVPVSTLPRAVTLIGAAPAHVYKIYGRPANVEKIVSGNIAADDITLVQYYDVEGGGRLAIMFRGQYQVGAIGFDNLHSTRYLALSAFFPPPALQRTNLAESCIAWDAYHRLPGDVYKWPGDVPNPAMVATTTAKWDTRSGGVFYARYRLEGHARKSYDPVGASDRLLPPRSFGNLKLLQFVWFPSGGEVRDAHPANDADLSTTMTSFNDAPCFGLDDKPIH